LIEIGEARDKSPAQIALNWLLQQPGVTAPIFGARTLKQVEDNMGSVGWALTAEEIVQLNTVSDVPMPSPYNFIAKYTRKRDEY